MLSSVSPVIFHFYLNIQKERVTEKKTRFQIIFNLQFIKRFSFNSLTSTENRDGLYSTEGYGTLQFWSTVQDISHLITNITRVDLTLIWYFSTPLPQQVDSGTTKIIKRDDKVFLRNVGSELYLEN